ncbi:MAG: hypothetical protein HZA16_14055 [Nitrospirae bacterium]|nr:hypothetical protein [Nitrospirota bacterium]
MVKKEKFRTDEEETLQGMGADAFNLWMKSQKEFSDTWLKSQSDFIESWMSATKDFQVSFLSLMSGGKNGESKEEISKLMESWREFMHDSYKVFNDGIVKMQETWKGAFDKQMEISRELAKKSSDLVKWPTKR